MKLASILYKVVMALTGLAWFGFLITHMSANLLILQGPEVFNAYPVLLRKTGALLYVAEGGLVLLLLGHIVSAFRVVKANRTARPESYQVGSTFKRATLGSRTMVFTGVLLLVFLVIHLSKFKFGDWTVPNGLWGLVVTTYKNPLWVAWYVFALCLLGLHLSHGLGSAFQTLGVVRPAWRRNLMKIGRAAGWLMAIGFIVVPLYAYFFAKS